MLTLRSTLAPDEKCSHGARSAGPQDVEKCVPNARLIAEVPALVSLTSTFFLCTYTHIGRQASADIYVLTPLAVWIFVYILSTSIYFNQDLIGRDRHDSRYLFLGVVFGTLHGLSAGLEPLEIIIGYLPGWILGSLVLGAQLDLWLKSPTRHSCTADANA